MATKSLCKFLQYNFFLLLSSPYPCPILDLEIKHAWWLAVPDTLDILLIKPWDQDQDRNKKKYWNRDEDQIIRTKIIRTGTDHKTQKGPGLGLGLVPVTFPEPRHSIFNEQHNLVLINLMIEVWHSIEVEFKYLLQQQKKTICRAQMEAGAGNLLKVSSFNFNFF